jgi:hypothetical protein
MLPALPDRSYARFIRYCGRHADSFIPVLHRDSDGVARWHLNRAIAWSRGKPRREIAAPAALQDEAKQEIKHMRPERLDSQFVRSRRASWWCRDDDGASQTWSLASSCISAALRPRSAPSISGSGWGNLCPLIMAPPSASHAQVTGIRKVRTCADQLRPQPSSCIRAQIAQSWAVAIKSIRCAPSVRAYRLSAPQVSTELAAYRFGQLGLGPSCGPTLNVFSGSGTYARHAVFAGSALRADRPRLAP